MHESIKDVTNKLKEETLLEQAAEEATEFAQACLKYARKLRAENPTPKTKQECLDDLVEETADITLSISSLVEKGIMSYEAIDSISVKKEERWLERLSNTKK